MKQLKWIRRVVASTAFLGGVWFVASFVLAAIINVIGCPGWVELPWSRFGDFVETTDGRVYVETMMYGRILCYDRNGKFLQNCSGRGRDTRLASGTTGLLYFRTQNCIIAYDANWERVIAMQGKGGGADRRWRLSDASIPVADNVNPGVVPDRAIGPGELLFSPKQRNVRVLFDCADGTKLVRGNLEILRVDKSGQTVARYANPRWFWLFTYPHPAKLAFPAFFIPYFLSMYLYFGSPNSVRQLDTQSQKSDDGQIDGSDSSAHGDWVRPGDL